MKAETIMDMIGEAEYGYYGIRIELDVDYALGDTTNESRIWCDGTVTDLTLDGTSCVGIPANANMADINNAIKTASHYFGNRIYLIGGDQCEYGEDAGEYIITDATVVAILA